MRILIALIVVFGVQKLSYCKDVYKDIFRVPGLLKVSIEGDSIEIDRNEEFKLFVKNGYPATLKNVRLTVRSAETEVSPRLIEELTPGDEEMFLLRLIQPELDTSLVIEIGAEQIATRPALEFSIHQGENQKTILKVKEKSGISPVGQVTVRVERFAELRYYLYLIPIAILVGLLIWRRTRHVRGRE